MDALPHTASAIGKMRDSRDRPVTPLMWRGNRLVDILTKSAASRLRLPSTVTNGVLNAAALTQHIAARLGLVTHLANNHEVTVTGEDGVARTTVHRDSSGKPPHRRASERARPPDARGWNVIGPTLAESAEPPSEETQMFLASQRVVSLLPTQPIKRKAVGPPPSSCAAKRRSLAKQSWQLRQKVEEDTQVANWLSRLELRASTVPAADRMEALRTRLREAQPEVFR